MLINSRQPRLVAWLTLVMLIMTGDTEKITIHTNRAVRVRKTRPEKGTAAVSPGLALPWVFASTALAINPTISLTAAIPIGQLNVTSQNTARYWIESVIWVPRQPKPINSTREQTIR